MDILESLGNSKTLIDICVCVASGMCVCVCNNAITKTSKLNMIRANVKLNLDGQKMITKLIPINKDIFI